MVREGEQANLGQWGNLVSVVILVQKGLVDLEAYLAHAASEVIVVTKANWATEGIKVIQDHLGHEEWKVLAAQDDKA